MAVDEVTPADAKAITVCVGYDDILALTLPKVAAAFQRVCVVTAPSDRATILVAESQDNVFTYQTDAFYRQGAIFNKGLSLEEGFDALGRDGWICVLDADIVLPETMDFAAVREGCLHTPRRRYCFKPETYRPEQPWSGYPAGRDNEHAGYFQLFHGSDPVLQSRPWYGTTWKHAGGCDSEFQFKWPREKKLWLPFEVLHLGRDGRNWWGRQTPRLDGTIPAGSQEAAARTAEMYHRRPREGQAWEKLTPQGQ